jgi:hypothetical protein
MAPSRPELAQRATVLGLTLNIAATCPGVKVCWLAVCGLKAGGAIPAAAPLIPEFGMFAPGLANVIFAPIESGFPSAAPVLHGRVRRVAKNLAASALASIARYRDLMVTPKSPGIRTVSCW